MRYRLSEIAPRAPRKIRVDFDNGSGMRSSREIAALLSLLALVVSLLAYPLDRIKAQTSAPAAVLAMGVDTVNNDPTYATGSVGYMIAEQMFEPLVGLDDNMVLRGLLAESWKPIGLLRWQFKLRRGVKFHSGAPFDASAVKFSWERLYDPKVKTTNRAIIDILLDRVEVVDPYTVNVITKKPVANLPYYIGTLYMIDPSVYRDSKDPINNRSSGTGPFKFVEWVRDSHFTMAANKDYWGGAPRLSRVVFRPIPEASTRVAELLTGAADIIQNVPPDQIPRIETATTKVVVAPGGRDMFVGLRADKPPFNDVRVRRAANYAVDVRTINQQLLGGYGDPYGAIVMPPRDNPKVQPYPYDPQKAKALLAQAGYAAGFGATLQTPNGRYLKDKEAAQAIAGYLANVGIKVTVEVLDWSVMFPSWQQHLTKEMFLLGHAGYYDGQGELAWVLNDISRTGWESKEYRELFNTLSLTFDQGHRKQLMMKAQEIAFDEAPWLFLWREPAIWGAKKGFDLRPRRDEHISLKSVTVR